MHACAWKINILNLHLECVPRKDDCSTNTTIPQQTCVLSNTNAAKEQHCTQSEPEPASESLEELLPLLEEGAGPAPASISAAAGSSRATRGKPRGCNNNIPQLSKTTVDQQANWNSNCYVLLCAALPSKTWRRADKLPDNNCTHIRTTKRTCKRPRQQVKPT